MFGINRRLKQNGVLGINRRNAQYIMRYNPRSLYPLVDDKLRTKQLALDAGMAVPELYGVVKSQYDVRRLADIVAGHNKFVIKPAHGSGGDGILVIDRTQNEKYRTCSGQYVPISTLKHHVSNTLSGQYSLGGLPDNAMIEYCVEFDSVFEAVSYRGVPDVRIIVLMGYPVMAMVRLPTRMSVGKANLHQGAIGVGVDLASGVTLQGVWGNSIINEHPDTGNPITGIQIPEWGKMMESAARCFELSKLGYLGVDIVLDRDLGPLILELNARPGLNIQIANCEGLHGRLQTVEKNVDPEASVDERLAFSADHFRASPDLFESRADDFGLKTESDANLSEHAAEVIDIRSKKASSSR
ncbi:MAG: alpha-L-glutamate ligase-like protein [Pseudomonadota bacterium]